MRKFLIFSLMVLGFGVLEASAQRRGSASATFAVVVTDPDGVPISNVLVTLQGAVTRSARTEAGRIAFEGLPTGTYKFRFERDGFVTLERDVTARSSTPVDVKVALSPVPPPPPPPVAAAPPPPPPPSTAKPAVMDVPAVIEKNYIGRGAGRSLTLACAGAGTATLIQLNEPLKDEAHATADEFLYTIAGEGTISMDGRQERLKAGVLVLVPRGLKHTLTATGRSPLVLVATRAGEGCTDRRP